MAAPVLTKIPAQGAPQGGRPGAAANKGDAPTGCITHPSGAQQQPWPRPSSCGQQGRLHGTRRRSRALGTDGPHSLLPLP